MRVLLAALFVILILCGTVAVVGVFVPRNMVLEEPMKWIFGLGLGAVFIAVLAVAYYLFNRGAETARGFPIGALAYDPDSPACVPSGSGMCTLERILTGGTDAGSMVVFDPAALPQDFDAKLTADPPALLKQLMDAGRLFWIDPSADGSYELGVFVGDGIPERLLPFAKKLGACERFPVPSGRLFFAGFEYVFQSNDARLRKYPHMGESLDIPPGEYQAEFLEFAYPDLFEESFLKQRLSRAQYRVRRCMNYLAPIGCLSLLALLGSIAALPWAAWATFVLPCGLILIALPLAWSRLTAYRQADAIAKSIVREYPGFGVCLRPIAATAQSC